MVKREEFEAVKEMARLAREENEALKARIAALEAKLGGQSLPETKFADAGAAGGSAPNLGQQLTSPVRRQAGPGRFRPGFLVFAARHRYRTASLRLQHPWRHAAGEKPSNHAENED